MFDFIRGHQRLMQAILLLLIIPSFVFFGVESLTTRGAQDAVAEVAGRSISQQEWDNASRGLLTRLAQSGQNVADSPELKEAALNELIDQNVLSNEANRLRLAITDDELREIILQFPGLKRDDGTLDLERFKAILSAQGFTPALYEAQLARDIMAQRINALVRAPGVLSNAHAKLLTDQFGQERVVKQQIFFDADYQEQVNPTPEQLQATYDKETSSFNLPESASVEYLILNRDQRAKLITIAEDKIVAEYNSNKAQYASQAERRARHILVKFPDGKTDADTIATAKKKAELVQQQLQKKGASFVQVAKQYSDDTGSAALGGELPWFGRGAMVKNFEEAAFSQPLNVVGPLVQTEFGFHLIEVLEKREPETPALEQVREQITQKLREAEASRVFSADTELFSNLVYEQADSLKAAADKFQLTIQRADNVTRTASSVVELNSPKFLTALFSNDSLKEKRNVEAQEVTPGVWVAARVISHSPSKKRPLNEVLADVTSLVKQQQARQLAIKAGQALLAQIEKNPNQPVPKALDVTYSRAAQNVDPELLAIAFKPNVSSLPVAVGSEYPNGYVVMQVVAVKAPQNQDPARMVGAQQLLQNVYRDAISRATIEALRGEAKVNILRTASATPVDGQK